MLGHHNSMPTSTYRSSPLVAHPRRFPPPFTGGFLGQTTGSPWVTMGHHGSPWVTIHTGKAAIQAEHTKAWPGEDHNTNVTLQSWAPQQKIGSTFQLLENPIDSGTWGCIPLSKWVIIHI